MKKFIGIFLIERALYWHLSYAIIMAPNKNQATFSINFMHKRIKLLHIFSLLNTTHLNNKNLAHMVKTLSKNLAFCHNLPLSIEQAMLVINNKLTLWLLTYINNLLFLGYSVNQIFKQIETLNPHFKLINGLLDQGFLLQNVLEFVDQWLNSYLSIKNNFLKSLLKPCILFFTFIGFYLAYQYFFTPYLQGLNLGLSPQVTISPQGFYLDIVIAIFIIFMGIAFKFFYHRIPFICKIHYAYNYMLIANLWQAALSNNFNWQNTYNLLAILPLKPHIKKSLEVLNLQNNNWLQGKQNNLGTNNFFVNNLIVAMQNHRLLETCIFLQNFYTKETKRLIKILINLLNPLIILLSGGILISIFYQNFWPIYQQISEL